MHQHSRITLYCAPGFDRRYLPRPAKQLRGWWDNDDKTIRHASFCLPLRMANSLGYVIPSPGTFEVSWDGNPKSDAKISIEQLAIHSAIDGHSARGSFTVQTGFIPRTHKPGDFIYFKGIPNQRAPYTCMEAAIEAWWNPANFALVFLINQACSFVISEGEPIAQMFVYAGDRAAAALTERMGYPPEHDAWEARRTRPDYSRDLDYMRGVHPDGSREPTHVTGWDRVLASKRKQKV